jgi:hypothetical protein
VNVHAAPAFLRGVATGTKAPVAQFSKSRAAILEELGSLDDSVKITSVDQILGRLASHNEHGLNSLPLGDRL